MKDKKIEKIDLLKDMGIFTFPLLADLRKDLENAGHSKKEIDEVIEGLSELPEYKNQPNKVRGK